jgi:hypothetical protein
VRFCPRTPGRYRYTLRVVDPAGAAEWREGSFEATPAGGPGFVRVAAGDRRYFELDTGEPFYPIGHNIRSPYDSRMDDFHGGFRHGQFHLSRRVWKRSLRIRRAGLHAASRGSRKD